MVMTAWTWGGRGQGWLGGGGGGAQEGKGKQRIEIINTVPEAAVGRAGKAGLRAVCCHLY